MTPLLTSLGLSPSSVEYARQLIDLWCYAENARRHQPAK